ncbi:MAG: thymidylate kinase [Dehalococcoidia bacterium]|nr:thymidylate kinase [Dehalococcoidia bacterium]
MSPMAELLLFGAARAELVETVIRPHLAQGHVVVADRYADSTIAYQHYGRQLPSETVTAVVHLATDGLTPDLTFLLDLRKARHLLAPSARRRSRPGQSQLALDQDARRPELDDGGQMRFERESAKFHERVRAGYRAMALKEPARWRVLDATLPIEDIHVLVHSHLQQSLSAVPNGATPTLLDLTNLPNL